MFPLGPTTPIEPVTPSGPVAPWNPISPVFPLGPTTPISPVTPSGPLVPVNPISPSGPLDPLGPVSPSRPLSPLCPGIPVGPLNPVGPSYPIPIVVLINNFFLPLLSMSVSISIPWPETKFTVSIPSAAIPVFPSTFQYLKVLFIPTTTVPVGPIPEVTSKPESISNKTWFTFS